MEIALLWNVVGNVHASQIGRLTSQRISTFLLEYLLLSVLMTAGMYQSAALCRTLRQSLSHAPAKLVTLSKLSLREA